MVLKTFNLDEIVYKEFSKHCRKNGISMSKKIENFIREEVEKLRKGGKIAMQNIPRKLEAMQKEHSMIKYC